MNEQELLELLTEVWHRGISADDACSQIVDALYERYDIGYEHGYNNGRGDE